MTYNRFFAFGCSITQYGYPTWADIIGYDLDIEYFNFGIQGLGNVGIASRILEADIQHKFTENDLIMIGWSSWTREDRFLKNGWQANGNVLNNRFYDMNFIRRYWSLENDIIKNSTAIISTNKIYKDLISYQFNALGKLEGDIQLSKSQKKLLEFYNPSLPVIDNFTHDNTRYTFDGHPTIASYITLVKDTIYPKFNLHLKTETIDYFYDLHDQCLSFTDFNQFTKLDIFEKSKNIVKFRNKL